MTPRTGCGSFRPALRLAGLTLLMAAAVAVSSCGKKITDVDIALSPPDYPEGVANASQLIVYPDVPVTVETWLDNGDPGPDSEDDLLSSELVYAEGAGAVIGTIIDNTAASKFQMFRRQGTHGFTELNDYTLVPARTWLSSHYDVFYFSDANPFPAGQREYVGRGEVSGVVTTNAPLTNVVTLSLSSVANDMLYTGKILPDTTRDSTFVMRWNSVAGAAGYWVSVTSYPVSTLADERLIEFALPRPIVQARIADHFVAYLPSTTPLGGQPLRHKLGDPLPAGAQLLHQSIGTNGALYFIRIVAVDANGQMLAYVGTNGSYGLASVYDDLGVKVVGQYRLFPIGGVFVQPQAFAPPPELARTEPGGPSKARSATLPSGLKIYDGAELRRVLRR